MTEMPDLPPTEHRPGCVLILFDGRGYLILDDYQETKERVEGADASEMMSFASCRDLGPGRPELDPCAITFERRAIVGVIEMTDKAWNAKVHRDEEAARAQRTGGFMMLG